MTARNDIRVGKRRLARDRPSPIDAVPPPSVGVMLSAARERKGVDLYRAERDTKIRAKYLAALEDSDYRTLPGAVYTKGFLRNYALYLGLDPDEMVNRWRTEAFPVGTRATERVTVAPPRPIQAPRTGFTISRGLFVAVLLMLFVAGFVGYIVFQVFRFSQTPALTLRQPATLVVEVQADSFTLQGSAEPGSTVKITSLATNETFFPTLDAKGDWSREVALSKGQNDFRIVATAPTGKDSDPLQVRITVPVNAASPNGSARSSPVPSAITLSVTSPADGASFSGGAVPLAGTTDAARLTVRAEPVGGPTAGAPSGAASSPAVPSASRGAPAASPAGPPGSAGPGVGGVPERAVAVGAGGAFSDTLQLSPGTWRLTFSATATGRPAGTIARTVTVPVPDEVQVRVEARTAPAWIQVSLDGVLAPGYANGKILARGQSVEFTARSSVTVRTGNAAATYFVVNGKPVGQLSGSPNPETWLFGRDRPPQRIR